MQAGEMQKMLNEFKQPPNEFRPAPFWFWNHRLQEGELLRQIDEMAAQGIGGFVMHARHGLLTDYLGDDWMRFTEKCCEKAEQMGMVAWLYDEENWPSGTAGVKVTRDFPQYRMSQLCISDQQRLRGGSELVWKPAVKDELLYVIAYPEHVADFPKRLDGLMDLTANFRDGEVRAYLPDGEWRVVAFSRVFYSGYYVNGYLDVLNQNGTKEFIKATHELYVKSVGKHFGKCLKGIFTDEPSTYYSDRTDTVQWTPALPKEFEKHHGYSLQRALLGLFGDTGRETSKFRNDFMETVTRMYRENFFKPIHDFCQANNFKFIGHVNSEGEFLSHVREQGDFFETAKYMDWGGCDCLFDTTWPKVGTSNNLLGVKFASSAAHLLGKPRTMSEACGVASGWDLNLFKLKSLLDWQIALGVNYVIPHAAYYSLEGFRKWECPPDEFYHNPYWRYYNQLAGHIGRLCSVFSNGRHVARTAVLSPVAAVRGRLMPDELYYALPKAFASNEGALRIQKMLENVSETLLHNQFDFDLMNEEILQNAVVVSGENSAKLEVRGPKGELREDFESLVLPSPVTLSKRTFEKLKEFAEAGGIIVFFGEKTESFTETGADPAASSAFDDLLKNYADNVFFAAEPNQEILHTLKGRIRRDVDAGNAPDLIYQRYEKNGFSFFLLHNSSREQALKHLTVSLRAKGYMYLLDTEDGSITPLSGKSVVGDDYVRATLDIAPVQSRLILVSQEKLETAPAPQQLHHAPLDPIEFDTTWDYSLETDNYLPLAEWTARTESTSDHRGWLHYHHVYTTTFQVAEKPESLRLLLDGIMRQERYHGFQLSPVHVEVNGQKLEKFLEGEHYDRLVPEAEIAPLAVKGENSILIRTTGGVGEAAVMRQSLYIAGKFALKQAKNGWTIVRLPKKLETGSWTEQGFPFFSGCMVYEQKVKVAKEYTKVPVQLVVEGITDTMEVLVNGKSLGARVWPPYEMPLTGELKAGSNMITIKVTNTLQNVFRQQAHPSGLLGKVKIQTL